MLISFLCYLIPFRQEFFDVADALLQAVGEGHLTELETRASGLTEKMEKLRLLQMVVFWQRRDGEERREKRPLCNAFRKQTLGY